MIILPGDRPQTPYPDLAMKCDAVLGMLAVCMNPPMRAPRVVVPSATPEAPDHRDLTMMTTLHFCELHKSRVKLADLLRDDTKTAFEATAKKKRPHDFKCNFDKAYIEWVLTTTPEYRGFMLKLGYKGIRALALP